MILRFFFDLLFGVVSLVVALLPTLPSMAGLNVSLGPIFYITNFLNLFIDLPMLGYCLITLLVVYNAKFAFGILRWLLAKLPGVS